MLQSKIRIKLVNLIILSKKSLLLFHAENCTVNAGASITWKY